MDELAMAAQAYSYARQRYEIVTLRMVPDRITAEWLGS